MNPQNLSFDKDIYFYDKMVKEFGSDLKKINHKLL